MRPALLWTILGGGLAGAAIGLAASVYWPVWAAALAGWGCANAFIVAWA